MALEEYAAKRKFKNTPEPQPGRTRAAGNSFCVQRHDATRLHYDFRLEVDGVLKSWAIPKGPTLDPGVKHLAAMVEDHPLEYGGFEGNIPAGNYGAGSVMLWDRGEYELLGEASAPEQLARGDFKFRLHGEKLNGEFALVLMKGRGKGNEWLIIKKRDQYGAPGWNIEDYAYSALSGRTQQEIAQDLPARSDKRKTAGPSDRVWKSSRKAARSSPSAAAAPAPVKKKIAFDLDRLEGARKATVPTAIQPMKATLATDPPPGKDWVFEIKWDGVRALTWVDGEKMYIQSRTGIRCERQYPELAVIPHYLTARQAILDGEIAVLDENGVSRFHLIQPRIANSDPAAIARLMKTTPVVYLVFDLLYLDGYDLRNASLRERKNLLRQALTETPVLKISADFAGSGEELLAAAREHGLEGILAKRADSRYESKRSRDWVKIKIEGQQEFVIGGFTAPQGSRQYFGALVLGVYGKGGLTWVGNVGTGFDQKLLAEVHAKLEPLITETCPFSERPKPETGITYVRPELVCQVKFSNWTPDGRLRAPVFEGLRNDVGPREVARELPDPPPDAAPESGQISRIPEGKKEVLLRVDGHSLKLTNLDKVFYPAEGYSKRDILDYYDSVADLILPHLKDRPLSLKRYPNGIEEPFFFQKDIPKTFASWLRTEMIPSDSERGVTRYVFAQDRASLLYLVNLGCIDHNPWMSRWPTLDNPDFVLIDLDPYECPFEMVVEAALLVKRVLDRVGLHGYAKTTGGDGMHVYIPVEAGYSYDDSRIFAELIGQLAFAERPEMFTTPRAVSKRQPKRVYFDYLQNGKSKTIAAPYVLRAYPGAPVATPLEWNEVKPGLSPAQFNISNAVERFAQTGDLFAPVLHDPQRLEDALEKLESLFHKTRKSAG